jgi:hypothetical protein
MSWPDGIYIYHLLVPLLLIAEALTIHNYLFQVDNYYRKHIRVLVLGSIKFTWPSILFSLQLTEQAFSVLLILGMTTRMSFAEVRHRSLPIQESRVLKRAVTKGRTSKELLNSRPKMSDEGCVTQ